MRPLVPILPLALGIATAPPVPSVSSIALLACAALLVSMAALASGTAPRSLRALGVIALGLALYLAGALGARSERIRSQGPLEGLPAGLDVSDPEGRTVRMTGRFEDDPVLEEGRLRAIAACETLEDLGIQALFPGRVALSWPAPEELRDAPPLAGRRFRATVRIRLPRSFGNPGGFDLAEHFHRRGILCLASIKNARLLELDPAPPGFSPRAWVRRRYDRVLERLFGGADGVLSPEGSVLRASVLGGRVGLPPESERALVASGVYHILAVSGLQVAVLAGILLAVLRRTRLPSRCALLAAAGGVVVYAAIVAPSASVERAALMATLAGAGRFARRRTLPMASLAAAGLCLLCARPSEIQDPGFQLTFAATSGLLLFAGRLGPHLRARWGFSALLASTLSAQVATWPLVALWFHRMVPYGLASNLLAVPLGALSVVLGIALLPADLISPPLAGAVGAAAGMAVEALLAVAAVPVEGTLLSFRVPEPRPSFLACASAGVVLLAIAKSPRRLAAAGALLTLSALLIVVDPFPREPVAAPGFPRGSPAPLTIDALDVGQGDAILVGFPNGETLLVDGGGLPGSSFDIGERVVVPDLERRGLRRLGRVVLTHAHEDHGGGLRDVLRTFAVGELLTPDAPEGPLRDELERLAHSRGIRTIRIRRGYSIREGETTIETLAPFPGATGDPNTESIVLRISQGGRSALLTGDIGSATERRLLDAGLAPADVLKVAHHGSAGATSERLLETLSPRLAVISVGSGNRFGHPAGDVLKRLARARATVLRTDRDGAVRAGLFAESLLAGSLLRRHPLPYGAASLHPRGAARPSGGVAGAQSNSNSRDGGGPPEEDAATPSAATPRAHRSRTNPGTSRSPEPPARMHG